MQMVIGGQFCLVCYIHVCDILYMDHHEAALLMYIETIMWIFGNN